VTRIGGFAAGAANYYSGVEKRERQEFKVFMKPDDTLRDRKSVV